MNIVEREDITINIVEFRGKHDQHCGVEGGKYTINIMDIVVKSLVMSVATGLERVGAGHSTREHGGTKCATCIMQPMMVALRKRQTACPK